MNHVYTVERLYHFLCGNCMRWWSIADFNIVKQDSVYCPHCGVSAEIIEGVSANLEKLEERPK